MYNEQRKRELEQAKAIKTGGKFVPDSEELKILKERYINEEITKEEYNRLSKELQIKELCKSSFK